MRLAERPPGQAAEMDYGRLGRIKDPDTVKQRTVCGMSVVLPHSRICSSTRHTPRPWTMRSRAWKAAGVFAGQHFDLGHRAVFFRIGPGR